MLKLATTQPSQWILISDCVTISNIKYGMSVEHLMLAFFALSHFSMVCSITIYQWIAANKIDISIIFFLGYFSADVSNSHTNWQLNHIHLLEIYLHTSSNSISIVYSLLLFVLFLFSNRIGGHAEIGTIKPLRNRRFVWTSFNAHIRLVLNGETINNSNNSLITVYEMILLRTRSASANREIRSIAIELQTQRHIIGFYCFSLIASNIGFNWK